MERSEVRRFESTKKKIKQFELQISETKGAVKAAETEAMKKFGTKDPEELQAMLEKKEIRKEKINKKLTKLSEQLQDKLEEIEEYMD